MAIEARVWAQVTNGRALLTESLEDGRTLLREVLSGPLVFTPNGEGYHFRAEVATGERIAGAIAAGTQEVASPGEARRWVKDPTKWRPHGEMHKWVNEPTSWRPQRDSRPRGNPNLPDIPDSLEVEP